MNKHDLLDRLQRFGLAAMKIADSPCASTATQNLLEQLSRSAASPALNYAEALGTIGIKDFANKLCICLKELRESHSCLTMLKDRPDFACRPDLEPVLQECHELTAIMVSSINTVQRKYRLKSK